MSIHNYKLGLNIATSNHFISHHRKMVKRLYPSLVQAIPCHIC